LMDFVKWLLMTHNKAAFQLRVSAIGFVLLFLLITNFVFDVNSLNQTTQDIFMAIGMIIPLAVFFYTSKIDKH
jgi:hypothetical protein